jgi:uncharacterized membrane protein YphA (DoxX/SURF4 family)
MSPTDGISDSYGTAQRREGATTNGWAGLLIGLGLVVLVAGWAAVIYLVSDLSDSTGGLGQSSTDLRIQYLVQFGSSVTIAAGIFLAGGVAARAIAGRPPR